MTFEKGGTGEVLGESNGFSSHVSHISGDTSSKTHDIMGTSNTQQEKPMSMMEVQLYTIKPSSTV